MASYSGIFSAVVENGDQEPKTHKLIFDLKGDGAMGFDIRSFNDPNASFKFDIPSLSTLNPTSSKLGFSLTK